METGLPQKACQECGWRGVTRSQKIGLGLRAGFLFAMIANVPFATCISDDPAKVDQWYMASITGVLVVTWIGERLVRARTACSACGSKQVFDA